MIDAAVFDFLAVAATLVTITKNILRMFVPPLDQVTHTRSGHDDQLGRPEQGSPLPDRLKN